MQENELSKIIIDRAPVDRRRGSPRLCLHLLRRSRPPTTASLYTPAPSPPALPLLPLRDASVYRGRALIWPQMLLYFLVLFIFGMILRFFLHLSIFLSAPAAFTPILPPAPTFTDRLDNFSIVFLFWANDAS